MEINEINYFMPNDVSIIFYRNGIMKMMSDGMDPLSHSEQIS